MASRIPFEHPLRQMGPIVKVKALGAGKGAVIAVVSDPNYEVIMGNNVKKNFTRSPRSFVKIISILVLQKVIMK